MTIPKCEKLRRLCYRHSDMARKPSIRRKPSSLPPPTSQASCLVTDIRLGDISGVELVHQLKADGYKYPTIFITAFDEEWVRSKVAAVGGIALLIKPFPSNALIEAVVKAIG